MNHLNIKIGMYKLLTFMTFIMLLSSCQKEEAIESIDNIQEVQEQLNENIQSYLLLMPLGFSEMSEASQIEYYQNLETEDFKTLAENHRIGSFLKSIGELENITNTMLTKEQLLTDIDLSKVLSKQNLVALSSYSYTTSDKKLWCSSWATQYSYYHPSNCYHISYSYPHCCIWKVQKRKCYGWGSWTEYRHRNDCL